MFGWWPGVVLIIPSAIDPGRAERAGPLAGGSTADGMIRGQGLRGTRHSARLHPPSLALELALVRPWQHK